MGNIEYFITLKTILIRGHFKQKKENSSIGPPISTFELLKLHSYAINLLI
jgi:hypothetical protein